MWKNARWKVEETNKGNKDEVKGGWKKGRKTEKEENRK